MAKSRELQLTKQKTLLNKQKIKIRKQIIKLERLLVNTDPESPLFTKYSEQKEELVIKLYSRETEYEIAINNLQDEVERLKKGHKDLNDIKKLIKEKKSSGFFNPGDPRLKKDLHRIWAGAKEAVNVKKKIRNLKEKIYDDLYEKVDSFMDGWNTFKDSYKYRFLHASVKGIVNLGLAPLKFATKAALTKKVDQKKFLGFSYGGRRVGRFKFNDNFMRKFSSDYKRLENNFYLMGNSLRNRDIKKGQLDAGDIILYLQEQGKTSEEIVDQLKEFQKYGIEISNAYQQLLNPVGIDEDSDEDFEDLQGLLTGEGISNSNPDDINFQNQAVFIDEENKEALRDSLLEFYAYIQNQRDSKKKKTVNLMETISEVVQKTAKGITKAFLWLSAILFSGKGGWFTVIAAAIAAACWAAWEWLLPDSAKEWISSKVNEYFGWAFDWLEDLGVLPKSYPAPENGSAEENAAYAMQRMIDEGYSKEFASGMMANLQAESNFNPEALGDKDALGNYTSGGLAQWHNERFDRLVEYSEKNGKNWKTTEAQMDYLLYEMKNVYNMDPKRANKMSAVEASRWITKNYEIPADTEYRAWERSQNADRYLAMDYENILKRAANKSPDAQTTEYAKRNINNQNKLINISGMLDDFDEEMNSLALNSGNSGIITGSGDVAANSVTPKYNLENNTGNPVSGAINNLTNPNAIGTSTALNLDSLPNQKVNDQIILQEEQKQKESILQAQAKKREALQTASGPGPIEIPSFLGGGDLMVLNTVR